MSNILDKIQLSGTTYDVVDSTAIHSLDGYATTGDVTAATSALAETIANQHYQTSGDVQNAIADKADKSEIPSVSGYADSVKYNSTSKYVEFYHGGTGGTKVFEYDASPFLIDGMVQNVEIKSVEISGVATTCLVISFNTDAGKQDINIPISEIFNAANYYTTAQTDSAIAAATSGKVDTSTYSTYTAATDTALSGKQETLVSGTNIKTVGGNTLLGSGDIAWPAGMTATVSGTTLIFS